MAIETERKYRIDASEADRLATILDGLGAEFVGADFEENIIYSSPDLAGRGAVLRIRKTSGRNVLTFKQNLGREDDYKRHLEIETGIDDPEATGQIIVELGLVKTLIYEKRRRTWRFRDTEIVIDELPFGKFLEIEGEKDKIAEMESILGISGLEHVRQTYPRLTMMFGRENQGVIEARFEEK